MPAPEQKPRLEDLPRHEQPPEIQGVYLSTLDHLEASIAAGQGVSDMQRRFALLYMRCCREKGMRLRPILAAQAYADLRAATADGGTPADRDLLSWLVNAFNELPKEERLKAKAVVQSIGGRSAPAEPPTVHGSAQQEEHTDTSHARPDAPEEKPKDHILRMRQARTEAKAQMTSFDEAVFYAERGIQAFPVLPHVLLEAAICFEARAGDKHRDREARLADLQRALDLLEEFILIVVKPPYKELQNYQAWRKMVQEQCKRIRAVFQQQSRKGV